MPTIAHEFYRDPAFALFSKRDAAYMQNPAQFDSFLSSLPDAKQAEKVIAQKQANFSSDLRALLQNELKQTYTSLALTPPQSIERLSSENTFVVVTAHQPCIFTGPLYFIYKIASAIALARKLQQTYPDKHFIAMYVVGSEDHDFDEIKSTRIFNKTITWESGQSGAVGRMTLSGIGNLLDEVEPLISKEPFGPDLIEKLRASYLETRTLAEATLHFVHSIFGQDDLLICDLDRPALKFAARALFERELNTKSSRPLVEANQRRLEELGYPSQIYARDINLFWLDDTNRKHIESDGNDFMQGDKKLPLASPVILDQDQAYHVSPNVVLRPLFQQAVLPAIAYVGGGAEVAYWMEIEQVFDHHDIPFPMLVRRDSGLYIPAFIAKSMKQVDLDTTSLFLSEKIVQDQYLAEQAGEEWSLEKSRTAFDATFQSMQQEALAIDTGLEKMLAGFHQQQLNFIEKLEGRLKKAIKSKHETGINRISKIWQSAFPNGSLQERSTNFIPFYARHGHDFIETIIRHFDPLNNGLHVFTEEK